MLIAVQIFFGTELALSVTFGDTSPKGRGFGKTGDFIILPRAPTLGELSNEVRLRGRGSYFL